MAQRKVVLLCLRGPDGFLEEVRERVPKRAAEELEEEHASEEACGVTCAPMGSRQHGSLRSVEGAEVGEATWQRASCLGIWTSRPCHLGSLGSRKRVV